MSESIVKRLSQFTPDGTGLDRDALLFAAGRASAQPGRHWRVLCAGLAVSQLLTLGALCWPRPVGPVPDSTIPIVAQNPAPPAPPPEPSLWRLREEAVATDGNLPARAAAEPLTASDPPLHAFGAWPADLLN
jgi:hypothetical protein